MMLGFISCNELNKTKNFDVELSFLHPMGLCKGRN